MSDAAQDFLDSGGASQSPLQAANDSNAAPSADPVQSFLDSGGKTQHPVEAKDKPPTVGKSLLGLGEGLVHATTGGVGALGGGLTYLGALAATGGDTAAAKAVQEDTQNTLTYSPRSDEGKKAAHDIDDLGSYLGQREGAYLGSHAASAATAAGLSPRAAGAIGATAETAANIPQFLLGATRGKGYSLKQVAEAPRIEPTMEPQIAQRTTPEAPVTLEQGAPRQPYFDIQDPQSAKTLGVVPEKAEAPGSEATLSPSQQQARMDLAKRVGLKEVRKSAIEGDAQAAADDFDATKYTEDPMGQRLRPVIAAEKQALADHGSRIIDDLGAKEGTDQSTLSAKGKTMSKPLDMLSDYADKAITKSYDDAIKNAGTEPVQFPKLEAALNSRSLKNSLLAQGKEGFLTGVKDQLEEFKENNGGQMNAKSGEQYRQFLNTLWKTHPEAVGKLKEAMDSDMADHFGNDVFGPSRQLYQLKKTLLDNPKGVAQIAGRDPTHPANRTTAYEDIPDKVANLDADQFKNLINTYKMMPDELQPQAQAAIAEIKGHQVNRLLDAGAKHATQWNKKGVNTELSNNAENFKTSFADDPKRSAMIKDLKDAGEMLRFNSSYRGAHAQTSNMLRKGVGVGTELAARGTAATLGTMLAGPPGTVAGNYLGGKAGGFVNSKLEARALKKDADARIVKIQ